MEKNISEKIKEFTLTSSKKLQLLVHTKHKNQAYNFYDVDEKTIYFDALKNELIFNYIGKRSQTYNKVVIKDWEAVMYLWYNENDPKDHFANKEKK